jgi:hypothetical protein
LDVFALIWSIPMFTVLVGGLKHQNLGLVAMPSGMLLFGYLLFKINHGGKVRVDLVSRTASRRYTAFGIPFDTAREPLDHFECVEIVRIETDESSSYKTRLVGNSQMPVSCQSDFMAARQDAEAVATFIGIGVVDRTGPEPVLRAAHRLDESLRQRLARLGKAVELPAMPVNLQSEIEVMDGMIRIEVPSPSWYSLLAIGILVFFPLAMMLSIPLALFQPPREVVYFIGTISSLVFGGVLLSFLWNVLPSYRPKLVTVTPDGISLSQRHLIRRKTRSIDASDLEELFCDHTEDARTFVILEDFGRALEVRSGVVARSDEFELRFGGHLSRPEQEYLCAIVKSVMVA